MTETETPPVYREATVMWRMGRADGRSCHAVIARRSDGLLVFMWSINGHPLGFREFRDWTSALDWSDRLQFQNWTVGWRLPPECDDAP
jgi:hypothetical protein